MTTSLAGRQDFPTLTSPERPDSLTEQTELSGRSKSNLSHILKRMSQYGFVELEAGMHGRRIPRVPYDRVQLEVSLNSTSEQVA